MTDIDIICLQETKGPVKIPEYKAINSTRPDSKYTSGGVAILFKHSIARGISQYHTKLSSDAVITKLSKKFFNTKVDYYVVNYYVSPHNSPYRKRMTNDPWATLDEILSDLQGKGEIILCGDFNARTGTHADYILDSEYTQNNLPFDLCSPGTTYRDRNNSDKITNTSCDDLIDIAIGHDLQILNGRTLGDILGKKLFSVRTVPAL